MWVFWFGLGIVAGSAANALIDRLPRSESWTKGRSHCDKCGHTLETGDLIPLLSYVFLRGRCRYCHRKIGMRNFLVELVMGMGFALIFTFQFAIFNQFSIFNVLVLNLILLVTVVISVMDWETKLVSEKMVLIWGALVLVLQFHNYTASNLIGLIAAVGLIGGLWAVSRKKAMGFGDVEIALVMGWWLGWPKIALALWVAFVVGAIVASWKLVSGKAKMGSEIAFGPFLVIGAWIGYFWGDKILAWVFRF